MKPKIDWRLVLANIEKIGKDPVKLKPVRRWETIKSDAKWPDGYDPIIEAEEKMEREREDFHMGRGRFTK